MISGSLRDRLWRSLADKRALLVLDNVRDARQLLELLPPKINHADASRVLAISVQPLYDALLPAGVTIQLNPFGDSEAMDLFQRYLGDDAFTIYKPRLHEIAKRLEYLPQLLATAAYDFSTNKSSPNTYLQALRKGNGQASILGSAIQEGLDLVFNELPEDEAELIELVGIFGEGDWRDSMLAAVALRPLVAVRQTLTSLAERSLIQLVGGHRYRANTLLREFAARRFNQQTFFRRQAAYTLLAHYCLDLAQDCEARLRVRPDQLLGTSAVVTDEFVNLFRERLMADMSHIRVVLQWALQHEAWDILRRFSYLSYLELLRNFNATGFEIGLNLTMATLYEPIVRQYCGLPELRIGALICSNEWSLRMTSTSQEERMQSGVAEKLFVAHPTPTDKDKKCELALEITAGHIIDGVFQHMSLVNGRWIAVRATGLICNHLDIVGSEIIASDLSGSVLVHCDARHVKLRSSNFSYALLRHVNLRGADLDGAVLVGTVFEHVDLRDANLQGANLSQAVLRQVDLRGADMRGANLSGAELICVDLIGAQIAHVRWAGAIPRALFVEDMSYLHEIQLAAELQAPIQPEQFALRERRVEDVTTETLATLKNVDLRGAELVDRDFRALDFSRSDLQAADLCNARLANANFAQATMRGINLTGANLTDAMLREANLNAAVLSKANLTRAILSNSQLRLARLSNTVLHKGNLAGADCTYAEFIEADLSHAILKESKLIYATLRKANLTEAHLDRAEIYGTDAQEADFSGAEILHVECIETTMNHATLTTAKLSGSFSETTLIGSTMHNANLSGKFIRVDFSKADLSKATLSGDFSRVQFCAANLQEAHITGIFTQADFRSADMSKANLETASLVASTLLGANVHDLQLQTLLRLRGTTLMNGDLYNGRFNLEGDRADADAMGYDLTDPQDYQAFYGGSRVRLKER
jgi:uncharacterized protein YjbI with pentapeptide repeats